MDDERAWASGGPRLGAAAQARGAGELSFLGRLRPPVRPRRRQWPVAEPTRWVGSAPRACF